MASNNSDSGGSMWPFVLGLLGLAVLLQALFGNNSTPDTFTRPASPERSYAETRFRQEGYSEGEAKQAAEAVMKFQAAQQNRK